jgi:hypothetical protein
MTVAVLGCAVLAAWSFDLPVLKSLYPDWATMKPNTALSFLMAGAAPWLLSPAEPAPKRQLAGRLGAVAVSAIALVTIAAYAFDHDLGIDQLLFVDPTTPATLHPGRPAPTTAGFFLLIAVALLLLRTSRSRVHPLVDLLTGAVVVGAYLAIIGYLYDAPALYTVPGYSSMALHTAIGHLLLGVGVFLAQPDCGVSRLIMSPRTAGGDHPSPAAGRHFRAGPAGEPGAASREAGPTLARSRGLASRGRLCRDLRDHHPVERGPCRQARRGAAAPGARCSPRRALRGPCP